MFSFWQLIPKWALHRNRATQHMASGYILLNTQVFIDANESHEFFFKVFLICLFTERNWVNDRPYFNILSPILPDCFNSATPFLYEQKLVHHGWSDSVHWIHQSYWENHFCRPPHSTLNDEHDNDYIINWLHLSNEKSSKSTIIHSLKKCHHCIWIRDFSADPL